MEKYRRGLTSFGQFSNGENRMVSNRYINAFYESCDYKGYQIFLLAIVAGRFLISYQMSLY